MNIEYSGRNLHVDDSLRAFFEEKFAKVTKFLEEPIEVRLTLEVEKHQRIADLHVAHRLGVLQATEETEGQMVEVIGQAVEKVGKQARRSHRKLVDRKRHGTDRVDRSVRTNGHRWPVEVLESTSLGSGAPRIIESTHLDIKPMTIEEAALQLAEAENGFVVFRDAQGDRLSVLYRRKDGNYGLIAPQL